MADGGPDTIEIADEDEDALLRTTRPAPVLIRGVGNLTLFGLSNRFDADFPQSLTGKVAVEEYSVTIGNVNRLLARAVQRCARWLVAGCLCCCCTAGCSLSPVFYLNKKTQAMVRELLEHENNRLYHKLGLHWQLSKQKCLNSNLKEYIILVEYYEKESISRPD